MVQREGLLEALRGLLARGEQRPRIVGKDVDVLVAPADLVGQHPLDISAKSATCPWTRPPPPAAVASSATDLTRSGSRPTSATSAPRRANSIAAARPMPRVAPVSTTTVTERTLPCTQTHARSQSDSLVHPWTGKRTRWRSSATSRRRCPQSMRVRLTAQRSANTQRDPARSGPGWVGRRRRPCHLREGLGCGAAPLHPRARRIRGGTVADAVS